MDVEQIQRKLLNGLTTDQQSAVRSESRRVLVVAGAGSGKTEVMARRIAWWVGVEGVSKDQIVAFTFTEKAAEEMKFRVRRWMGEIIRPGEEVSLGEMYVGTIHGFCLANTREWWPDEYHNYDVLDEGARAALISREFHRLLALRELKDASGENTQTGTVQKFIQAYDQLHEHNRFEIELPSDAIPIELGAAERDWCERARLLTDVGNGAVSRAFAESAARYYAYLRCRRFLDFSTSQSELIRRLASDPVVQENLADLAVHLVVDEVQDINPVQRDLIDALVGSSGRLTAVGDHRQAIYGFRGAKVELLGGIWNQLHQADDGSVINLSANFRSTPRILDIANRWADTIEPAGGMETPYMISGREDRTDQDPSHIALVKFGERHEEARWIAEAVRVLVPNPDSGAEHDDRRGGSRGISLSDIAVLVRSSTDVRTYMRALEEKGVPCVVKAGPDLFSQPEVLLLLAALSVSGDIDEYFGAAWNKKSLPGRIKEVLNCEPNPKDTLKAAAAAIRAAGLPFTDDAQNRLSEAADGIRWRIREGTTYRRDSLEFLRSDELKDFLSRDRDLRRVFPQQIYHWLLIEAGVDAWDGHSARGDSAMFHLGALSSLVTGMETPGWTSPRDFHWQMIGLLQFGSEGGRIPEQPLIVGPDAVTISTIHSAKGLEFAAVFLADVCARRFPSTRARQKVDLPIEGTILEQIDVAGLSENENYDGERRLMYVALTRSERFLFVSRSGKQTSKFVRTLDPIFRDAGATVTDDPDALLDRLRYAPLQHLKTTELSTSFSDMRYFLACPHDFYLRKVLGFAPTIDQAFGYGRGVHNLMRAIHTDPDKWAQIAADPVRLEQEVRALIDQGLFYLRYTTGSPARNMREKGIRIVCDYVAHFADELQSLTFEPEKSFETLVEYGDEDGGAMVSGAIDIVRQDDPPRVTLIDFKSGDPDSDRHQGLDEDEMRLQVAIYALAARKELEYEPERGLVRYLDADRETENHQLAVPLDPESVEDAKAAVVDTARRIRDRHFQSNPRKPGLDGRHRCLTCDFLGICGMSDARRQKGGH